jgi:hypothetical protein
MWMTSLIALSTVSASAEPTFLLRRQLRNSAFERFTFTIESKTTVELPGGMGEQSYSVQMRGAQSFRQTGTDIRGAKIEVSSDMEPTKVNGVMAGMIPKMEGYKGLKSLGRRDILNRFRSSSTKPAVPGVTMDLDALMASGTAFLFPEFPAERVAIGSIWKIQQRAASMAVDNAKSFITYTLSSREELNGIPSFVILATSDTGFTMKQKLPPNSGIPGGATEMNMTFSANLQGKIWIEAATGRTLRVEVGGANKSRVEMGRAMTVETVSDHKNVFIADR